MSVEPIQLPLRTQGFLARVNEHRTAIAGFVLAVMLVAAGVAMLLPKWYRADAAVLPPTESGDAFGIMSGLIENTALRSLGLLTTSTPSDVYAEILESRTLKESLIRRFQLDKVYRRKGLDRTLKELNRHMAVDVNPAGIIVLTLEDRDPARAAAMANHLLDELDRFNRESLNTRAKRTRAFLEERLTDAQERLKAAESALATYERRNKVVAASDDAAVKTLADLMARRMGLQVRRTYVQSYSQPGSAEIRAIDAELAAFDRELGKLPGLRSEGARLALDAEIQRKVFTLLTAQYEDARVQEMRDTPTITVLDRARAPELRARPKRALIVAVSGAVALLLALAWLWYRPRRTAHA